MNTEPRLWKAIVFDFDGTLAKLNIDFTAMRMSLLKLMAKAAVPTKEIQGLHILEMINAAGSLLSERGPEAQADFIHSAHEIVTRLEIDAAETGSLFDGTRMLLKELRVRSIRTGVVTRNCRAAVFRVFPDIGTYCQAILTREDPPHVKPHPDHLKAALKALRVDPAESAMVGDHPMDIRLGREAGTDTIGVLTGHSEREALRLAKADLIIDQAFDILDVLP